MDPLEELDIHGRFSAIFCGWGGGGGPTFVTLFGFHTPGPSENGANSFLLDPFSEGGRGGGGGEETISF